MALTILSIEKELLVFFDISFLKDSSLFTCVSIGPAT